MAFDFKKEYRALYLPSRKPEILIIPTMQYIALQGKGNPNDEDGAYQRGIGILYAVAYALKMSKHGEHRISGYFDYVVPPLEGLWWQDGIEGMDYARKDLFQFISMIRLPDFVQEQDVLWAIDTVQRKKRLDCSTIEFLSLSEGLCVQMMHIGPYDTEPETTGMMHAFVASQSYELDFSEKRRHHEIYLSDPRKGKKEHQKTVIRHPIRTEKDRL
ncbi:MAG: GyrI-like domain-containing protein [Sphaerochaetaceae bacterium]